MKQILLAFISGLVLSTSGVMAAEKTPDSTFNPFEEIKKMQMEMENIFERFHKKRLNEKNERLKNLSNYGILGVNEGLFTNDCKKVLNIVQSVLLAA